MSVMSTMVVLSLFLASVSPVAAELKPLEDGCLLQKTKEQQLLVKQQQLRVTPAYQKLCGPEPGCLCTSFTSRVPGLSNVNPVTLSLQVCANACAEADEDFVGFTFGDFGSFGRCRCCRNLDEDSAAAPWSLYAFGGSDIGDPHVTTLDGRHYTLLSQGTFSLWHFSGLETELQSEVVGTKKLPVDWQVYAHYSGQQSLTKGLLLIDNSGGSIRQVLEITSQDCKWKARKGSEGWKVVDNAELIFVPDGKDYVTGFDLSTVTGPRGYGGHGFPNRVRFNMNTKNGKSDIAVMSLSCRPNHNMNLLISMKRQSDKKFVDGELKTARKSLSTLQTSTDAEFSVDSKWQELGGSEQAASYFQLVETNQKYVASFQQGCSEAEKVLAKETCSKHLGEARGTENTHLFEDCIYDVCHGAGETQAELAAELLAVTKAD